MKLSSFGTILRSVWKGLKFLTSRDLQRSITISFALDVSPKEGAVDAKLESLDPALQTVFRRLQGRYQSDHPGREFVITHGGRRPVEQLRLFVQGRLPEFPGDVVTWKDGFVNLSEHNRVPSRAFDFGIKIAGKFEWRDSIMVPHLSQYIPVALRELGVAEQVRYGGSFGDYYHVELRK